MCGICGSVGAADPAVIAAMNRAQAHRGPDGEGIKTFPSVNGGVPAALGHRRLSIIDPTERGAQPMCWRGRYWITYNGELYNFRALRSELEADGIGFATECDTEVLLASYERWGAEMLDRLNGIFAFGIWDTERQELFLARDRLGVKPLYFARAAEAVFFASEAKALFEAVPTPSLDAYRLAQYLTFLWVPQPATLFEGIRQLAPGHWARWSDGRLTTHQYWDLEFDVEPADESVWAERLRHGIDNAVERQMISDVPLGAFLSGGLDSTSIVNAMRKRIDDVQTYSIGFDVADQRLEISPDDLGYARRVASDLGVENHANVINPSVVDLLPRLVWHLDEPIADPAAITSYLICAAARERLTVVLSGTGADEMLAGYPRYLAASVARPLAAIPSPLRAGIRSFAARHMALGPPGRMRQARRNALEVLRGIDQPGARRFMYFNGYYRPEEVRSMLTPDADAAVTQDPFADHEAHAAKVVGQDWLNQLLYIDAKTYLPSLNLAYTDKMGMAASTEVRVPLLDDELVPLIARIPPRMKLRGSKRKHVMRQAMTGVLPDYVIDRKKAGFGAPIRSWLVGDLKPMVSDLLSPDAIRNRGLFRPEAVQRLLDENATHKADHSLRIWALLVLELWQQKFLDGSGASSDR